LYKKKWKSDIFACLRAPQGDPLWSSMYICIIAQFSLCFSSFYHSYFIMMLSTSLKILY
jgi:hypothetical protein